MVSPEYNHSMSPALAHLLNHFGSSLFSYKPSAIVTYSAGQWGGVRAAVGMRSFLSELGCLPVSAMIHIPKAHEVLAEDGNFIEPVDAERCGELFFQNLHTAHLVGIRRTKSAQRYRPAQIGASIQKKSLAKKFPLKKLQIIHLCHSERNEESLRINSIDFSLCSK